MRKFILFLVLGTIVTILLIALCTVGCALLIIVVAKLVSAKVLVALPFSIIAGMIAAFILYGKVIKKTLRFFGIDDTSLRR